jgi:hypothetical protein
MRSTTYSLPALGVFILGLACSSKSGKTEGDGSVGSHETGKATDSGSTIDGGRRDAGGVAPSGLDGSAVRDTADVRDGRFDLGALDVVGTKDSTVDRADAAKAGDAKDATADVNPDLAPVGKGTCASPIDISLGLNHADIMVKTGQATHLVDFPCASNGADVVLRFEVTTETPQLVYADTFGVAWNTALLFTDSCDTSAPPPGNDDLAACNDDACGTSQSQALAMLNLGFHYLIVSGVNDESGDVTVHFQHALLGTGPFIELAPGSGSVQGTTSGVDFAGQCQAVGPKNAYWWLSCPDYAGGPLLASTCGGADWDTVLSLQIPRTDDVECNDDDTACGILSTLNTTVPPGAGIQILAVGGSVGSSMGDYTLTYSLP